MSDDRDEDRGVLPHAEGLDFIAKVKAKQALAAARCVSPVTYYGADALCTIASELQSRNKTDKPVTVRRLALRLRGVVRFASDAVFWSIQRPTEHHLSAEDIEAQELSPEESPTAEIKKNADRKLKQAKAALYRLVSKLEADDVSIFTHFDRGCLEPLEQELERMKSDVDLPIGLRRGHPIAARIVRDLHRILYNLTGNWLRDPRDAEHQDDFIRSLLLRLARPLTPNAIADEALQKVIETEIKRKKT